MKIFIILALFVLLVGCASPADEVTGKVTLTELEVVACNTADAQGTCQTRLDDLGIVLEEDCCAMLGKCCGGD